MTNNKKTIQVGVFLCLSLLLFSGYAASSPLENTHRSDNTIKLLQSSGSHGTAVRVPHAMLKQHGAREAPDISIVSNSPAIASASRRAVSRLLHRLSLNAFPIKKIVVGNVRYGETRHGSRFGRRLRKEIERVLSQTKSITLTRRKEKLSTRSLNRAERKRGLGVTPRQKQSMSSPAMQAELHGAEAALEIRYSLEGAVVKVDLKLVESMTGKTLSASTVSIDKNLIPLELQEALIPSSANGSLPTVRPKKINSIEMQLLTKRGGDGAIYAEGEKIVYWVSSDHKAYLLLIYRDADGNLLQLFPNSASGDGYRQAGKYMMIPDENITLTDASGREYAWEFVVSSPFGEEQVWAFAATKPFPILKGKGVSNELRVLEQNLSQVVSQLRRHGSQAGARYGEVNLMITTVRDD